MQELELAQIMRVLIGFLVLMLAALLTRWRLVRIVFTCACATTLYALIQDQWSANFSPEYFTVGHPRLPGLTAPPLLGLLWGFLAGFPPGVVLGLPVAIAATLGRAPKLSARDLRGPLLIAMLATGAATAITAWSAAVNLRGVEPPLHPYWSARLAPAQQYPFAVVAHAHLASYTAAALSGLVLVGWALWHRRRLRRDDAALAS